MMAGDGAMMAGDGAMMAQRRPTVKVQ